MNAVVQSLNFLYSWNDDVTSRLSRYSVQIGLVSPGLGMQFFAQEPRNMQWCRGQFRG